MARKRKRDREDEELAREIAKVAGVTRYMQQVTEEDIKKQGDLYLKYASGMMGLSTATGFNFNTDEKSTNMKLIPPNEDGEQKLSTVSAPVPEEEKIIVEPKEEKRSTNAVLLPEPEKSEKEGTSTNIILIPEREAQKTSITTGFNLLSTNPILYPVLKNGELSTYWALNRKNKSTAAILNRFFSSTGAILNLYPVKVHFEQEHLIRFINGAHTILFYPDIDHRVKIVLLAILLKATCEKSVFTKVKTNDLLRALGMSKSLQKELPELAKKAGLAEMVPRKKAGTEVLFNEEIFNPYGKNGSNEIDRLIDIYNLSIYLENTNEEKIEEKKRIPLSEIGKYVLLISLHLAGFPLSAVTGSLLEAVRNKDAEIVTAFWIYAKSSSDKIKSPGAYLIKVLNNNDTGSLSGEIMEKAKICVKAAQTIVHENYDEPELGFLKGLAQRLSLTDAYYDDRASLTTKLKTAGRKLIDECEKALNKLPKKTV
jgi:hypothetical protein